MFGKKEIERLESEIKNKDSLVQEKEAEIHKLNQEIETIKIEYEQKEKDLNEQNELAQKQIAHERALFDQHKAQSQKALEEQERQSAQEIQSRQSMLKTQQEAFDAHLTKTTAEYDARLKKLETDAIALDNAKIEFEPKLREAESGFAQKAAENEREIQERTTQCSEELFARQKEFDIKLHDAHQKAEKEHEDILLSQTQKRVKETDEELAERRNAVAKQEADLRTREINLENDRNDLAQRNRDYETKNQILEAQIKNVEAKDAAVDEKAKELADAKIRELQALLENYKAQQDRLSQERADLETQVNSFNEIKMRLGNEEPEVLLTKLQSLQRQVAEYQKKIAAVPENVEEELNRKDDEIEQLNETLTECKTELNKAQAISFSAENAQLKIASLESQNEVLTQDNNRLETLNAEQDATIKRYRELYDKKASLDEKLQTIMMPHPDFTEDKIKKEAISFGKEQEDSETDNIESDVESEESNEINSAEQEIKWLSELEKNIELYGLKFHPRILYAFHTALKTAEWSPLAVLAGVSGTGKSELPKLYCEFGGINFLNVPVQPNWDSQEALLGYYNTIESRFDATLLLQFLVQTQQKNTEDYNASLKNQMNIVLLDEMNLAHIEQYFAEFLSKLEERRGKNENNLPKLDVHLGGTDRYELPLGRNVLWVGTMNQDETTKSLSDKVLDRGIVINFPHPNEFVRRSKLNKSVPKENHFLSVTTWNSWKSDFNEETTEAIIKPYKELVEKINKSISNIGRAIGHRVWQSIENYIWNYPKVRKVWLSKPELADGEDSSDDFKKELCKEIDFAFEDQLVQKIMPKLRGIETRGESKNCLDEIKNNITAFKNEGHTLNILPDFENAIKFGDGQFLWVTSEYLNMVKNKIGKARQDETFGR